MRQLFVLTVAALFAAGAGFALAGPEQGRAGQSQPPAKKAPGAPAPSQAAVALTMPPLPSPGYAPGRPVDQAHAVYTFAAKHPEILKYVPCYCGCENDGHPHNESCFVKRRDAKGNVLEWDIHGYG